MICRLCLTETEFCLPLKKEENQEKEEEREDIVEIIRKHFDLELHINSDLVCTVCWQQISEFHTFYLYIEEKQKELIQQSPLPAFTSIGNDATRECNRYRLQICRLCLTGTEFCLPLTNTKNQEKDEETEDIAEIMRKHFDLELDINSDFVCTVCWQQISEFHTFYLFIEENQKEFSQQNTHPALNGTRNDATSTATDYDQGMAMTDEVPAKDSDRMDIENEFLMDINAPMAAEKVFSLLIKEETPQEATENLDTKNEFIDEVDIEASNYETSDTLTETDSKYEMDLTDNDNDEVDIKNESVEHIKNDQVDTESASCETNTSGIAKATRTQQSEITSTEGEKKALDKELNNEKSDLIIAQQAGILKCELCAQTVETFGNLWQHFEKKHGRKGYVRCCNKRYYLSYTYAEHLEWHSYPNFWRCEPCNLAFSCRGLYMKHLFNVHPEGESSKFQCILCWEIFLHGNLLRQHIRSQHSGKTFKCDECNKEFKTVPDLKIHKKIIHQRVYRTDCDICGKSFVSSRNCRNHKEKVHKVEDNLSFQCSLCPKKFAIQRLLDIHRKQDHNAQKIKCEECEKEFKNLSRLREHEKRSHQRTVDVQCNICGKTIRGRSNLYVHIVTVHQEVHGLTEYLSFECPLCPKKFPLEWLLKNHLKRIHNAQKSKCDECDKEYKNLMRLQEHKRRIHRRAYETECDICGKIYTSRSTCRIHKAKIHLVGEELKVHTEDVHSKENSKCDVCKKEFKSLNSLRHHKRNIHKIFANSARSKIPKSDINHVAENLSFQCLNCSQKFVSEGLLNIHKSSCHNE